MVTWNPQIPRKLAEDNKPVTDWQMATFQKVVVSHINEAFLSHCSFGYRGFDYLCCRKYKIEQSMNQEIKNKGEIIIYQTPDGVTELDVRLENETVWLTQEKIAQLFGTKRPAITKHLNNIYKVGELEEYSTCSILEHMGNDAMQRYKTKYYNLDAILSVGYRVNSINATKFRIWANKVLKDYLIKGYAVNNKLKLKQYEDLKQTVMLLSNVIQNKVLTNDSGDVALFGYEKSFVQRWQQADCGIPFSVVFRKEWYFIQAQRIAVDRK